MTSRFAASYVCLNGPKEGDWVDSPCQVEVGSACAMPWFDAKHIIRYVVYVMVRRDDGKKPDDPDIPDIRLGLMYMGIHDTPEKAQQHVHRIAMVSEMAHQAAASEN